jgi:peptidoglycan/xylan/chitin deacetylase (PgdA/CDA1 family)
MAGSAGAESVPDWSVPSVKNSGTVILCYHRVAEGVEDPFGLCVSPDNFAAHLEEVARRREPSTLDDLSVPSRRPRVVVTFDDGYSDNLGNALPIAETKGVPITIFVTSGLLNRQNGFWWDRLAALLRSRPQGMGEFCLATGGQSLRIPLGASDFAADLSEVRRHLLPLSVQEIESALDAVSEHWSVVSTPPPDARALMPAELRQLAAAEIVTIGAHTVDHVRLRGRQKQEQVETITASRMDLERFLGRSVSHFAYPFGRSDDFDDCSVDAVRNANFDDACTTLPGTARPSTDPYRLPRRLVMDWGRGRFRAQLQRWRLG